jgi:hypothetical protein
MTVQELVDWCNANDVSLNTQLAIRTKDDYFVFEECLSLDIPYFGNSAEGEEWMEENCPCDEDGYIDYELAPNFLILDSFSG